MIARTWRGWTAAEDADAYLDYLHETGLSSYRATPGNKGVLVLRQIDATRAAFFIISLWESREAIRGFAGEEIDRAVFYPRDERFLIQRETKVDHFEVAFSQLA
jgi:heme-degrading monooxygenase HmoA